MSKCKRQPEKICWFCTKLNHFFENRKSQVIFAKIFTKGKCFDVFRQNLWENEKIDGTKFGGIFFLALVPDTICVGQETSFCGFHYCETWIIFLNIKLFRMWCYMICPVCKGGRNSACPILRYSWLWLYTYIPAAFLLPIEAGRAASKSPN